MIEFIQGLLMQGFLREYKWRHGKPMSRSLLLYISLACFVVAWILYPDVSFAEIAEIGDLKSLAKVVQDDIHGYGIPIILNIAGIGVAGFALITQRWQILILGGMYLIFVNVFFGFVKGKFGIK